MLPFSKQQEAQNYSAKFAAPFLHLCRDPTVFRAAFMQQSCLPHQLFVSIYSCACKNVWLSSNVLKHLVEPTFYHFLVVLLHKSRSTELHKKSYENRNCFRISLCLPTAYFGHPTYGCNWLLQPYWAELQQSTGMLKLNPWAQRTKRCCLYTRSVWIF